MKMLKVKRNVEVQALHLLNSLVSGEQRCCFVNILAKRQTMLPCWHVPAWSINLPIGGAGCGAAFHNHTFLKDQSSPSLFETSLISWVQKMAFFWVKERMHFVLCPKVMLHCLSTDLKRSLISVIYLSRFVHKRNLEKPVDFVFKSK